MPILVYRISVIGHKWPQVYLVKSSRTASKKPCSTFGPSGSCRSIADVTQQFTLKGAESATHPHYLHPEVPMRLFTSALAITLLTSLAAAQSGRTVAVKNFPGA